MWITHTLTVNSLFILLVQDMNYYLALQLCLSLLKINIRVINTARAVYAHPKEPILSSRWKLRNTWEYKANTCPNSRLIFGLTFPLVLSSLYTCPPSAVYHSSIYGTIDCTSLCTLFSFSAFWYSLYIAILAHGAIRMTSFLPTKHCSCVKINTLLYKAQK